MDLLWYFVLIDINSKDFFIVFGWYIGLENKFCKLFNVGKSIEKGFI